MPPLIQNADFSIPSRFTTITTPVQSANFPHYPTILSSNKREVQPNANPEFIIVPGPGKDRVNTTRSRPDNTTMTGPITITKTRPVTMTEDVTITETRPVTITETRPVTITETEDVTITETRPVTMTEDVTITETRPVTMTKDVTITKNRYGNNTITKTRPVTSTKTRPVTITKTEDVTFTSTPSALAACCIQHYAPPPAPCAKGRINPLAPWFQAYSTTGSAISSSKMMYDNFIKPWLEPWIDSVIEPKSLAWIAICLWTLYQGGEFSAKANQKTSRILKNKSGARIVVKILKIWFVMAGAKDMDHRVEVWLSQFQESPEESQEPRNSFTGDPELGMEARNSSGSTLASGNPGRELTPISSAAGKANLKSGKGPATSIHKGSAISSLVKVHEEPSGPPSEPSRGQEVDVNQGMDVHGKGKGKRKT